MSKPDDKTTAKQVIHKYCTGGLVLVWIGDEIRAACNKCADTWILGCAHLPDDWRLIKDSEASTIEKKK